MVDDLLDKKMPQEMKSQHMTLQHALVSR